MPYVDQFGGFRSPFLRRLREMRCWKNHLIKVTDKGANATIATIATYAYDAYDAYGLGRRTQKVVGSDTTRFVCANQQCLEEYDGSGNLLRLFAFGSGLDEVVMMEAPDVADVDSDQNTTELKRFYYHTQLIGSVTQVTDEDEALVESYDYGPCGEIEIFDQSASSVSVSQIGNPFTYTGRRLDEETGLFYYRTRHYSSELGRFIQRDPLEYIDGPNAYAYVGAWATARVDPTGTDDQDSSTNGGGGGAASAPGTTQIAGVSVGIQVQGEAHAGLGAGGSSQLKLVVAWEMAIGPIGAPRCWFELTGGACVTTGLPLIGASGAIGLTAGATTGTPEQNVGGAWSATGAATTPPLTGVPLAVGVEVSESDTAEGAKTADAFAGLGVGAPVAVGIGRTLTVVTYEVPCTSFLFPNLPGPIFGRGGGGGGPTTGGDGTGDGSVAIGNGKALTPKTLRP